MLVFLLGLRNKRIAGRLTTHGFSQKVLDDGRRRLNEVTRVRLMSQAPEPPSTDDLNDLDRWENKWFPVTQASLRFRFPEIHEYMFHNLHQTEGPEVVLSVTTFLERHGRLGDQERGKEAADLLAERGLTEQVVAEAEGTLNKIGTIEEADADEEPAAPVEHDAAVESMWQWYLEWSSIARVAISDRRLLRKLGFLRRTTTEGGQDGRGGADPGETDPGGADPGGADPGETDPGGADPGDA